MFSRTIVLAAIFCCISFVSFAQPSNDVCANAITLIPNSGYLSTTNAGTVTNGPNPSCGGGTLIRDIWYKFIYTGGVATIQTQLGGLTDTRIALYGSCGGSQIACNDDFVGTYASQLVLSCSTTPSLVVGNTYYIQAGGYQAQTGTFNIKVDLAGSNGCTDPNATNYSACATVDNGSCTYPPLNAAFFNFSNGSNCIQQQFTDNSEGNVVSWTWSFPGGSPSSSTLQNPLVTYPAAGVYSATLTVGTPGGTTDVVTQNVVVETGNIVTIDITPDANPQQTSWKMFDGSNNVIAQGTSNDATFCISDNCYRFEIYDSGGNGLTGSGSYTIYLNGLPAATGGVFANDDVRYINCPQGTSCVDPLIATLGIIEVPESNSWYAFTPAENGQYRISTCNLAACDTKIWLYDYCNMANFDDTNEASYTYNDDYCGVQAEITPYLEGGITYYVRIGDVGGACAGQSYEALFEYMGPVVGCMDILACNYLPIAGAPGPCYYNGDPNCNDIGPDLEIDGTQLFNTLYSTTINGTDACLVNEGCLQGLGSRQVLRFATKISNIGNLDYFIGVPNANNPQFEYDQCHNHYHYEGYAEYLLYDSNGNPMPQIGFKNGFCVLDLGCTTGSAKYGCGNMGITAGCYDEYWAGLSCQWIDITDVPAGTYHLVVRTNWDQAPDNNGNYELRYDNNWAQVCISFGRDGSGNIINFTKNINACPVIVDCVGQPFGDSNPDCAGNCPGLVKQGDLSGDLMYDNTDVNQYLFSSIYGNTPVSPCTDLNNDGEITVADAAYLDACIHTQADLGLLPAQMQPCAWDDEVFDGGETVTIGVANLNTTGQYFDITITNPNGEVNGMQFELSGATISSVQNLLPTSTWDAHISHEELGQKISVIGHLGTMIPVSTVPVPVMRVYYQSLQSNDICIGNITEVLNMFLHNTITVIGACQQVASIAADFTSNATSICSGAQVLFTNQSVGGATTYSWSFPGGTPSTSTAANPAINYYTQGVYSVTLTASNGVTSDTYTATNYITVGQTVTWYLDADNDGYGNPGVTLLNCVQLNGYVAVAGDCNDSNGSIKPNAQEVCNGIDDNCNGVIDEGYDLDNDGYSICQSDCDDNNGLAYPGAMELCNGVDDDCDGQVDEDFDQDGDGYTVCEGDCNDNSDSVYPGAIELCNGLDDNCNGVIDEGFDWDNDGYTTCEGDCNDNNASIHPNSADVCNGADDDCDGLVDEDGVLATFYLDNDGDGFGGFASIQTCFAPNGYVVSSGDCNDGNINVYPNAPELCDGIDNDCDGLTDENSISVDWFQDLDSDGNGGLFIVNSCTQPLNSVSNGGDCDDGDPNVYQGALELCDGLDNDCNGIVDDGIEYITYYTDADGDGYGTGSGVSSCEVLDGMATLSGDCDDMNANIHPGAPEICDEIDNDCNGLVDDNTVLLPWYFDNDGDGFGGEDFVLSCSEPIGTVNIGNDCDDADPTIHPGATELCDMIDNDCNGMVDDNTLQLVWYQDLDGDGYGSSVMVVTCEVLDGYSLNTGDCDDSNDQIHPDADDSNCNDIDDNCNGLVDEDYITDGCIYCVSGQIVNETPTWYLDLDGDGYAVTSISFCGFPGQGYYDFPLPMGDCDDNNNAVNPSTVEVCGNGVDDDCDGAVDEGCGEYPAPANDNPSNAIPIILGNSTTTCNPISGTLLGASSNGANTGGAMTGEDVWYQFVATQPGARIEVMSTACNIQIVLQDALGNTLNSENTQSIVGGEILNYGGLTIGQVYMVGVENYNSNQGSGDFTICIKPIIDSGCDYGPGPYSLCQVYKATWAGPGVSYRFDFDRISNGPGIDFTRTQSSDILVLSNVPGLMYNESYMASITAIYSMTNASGGTEIVEVAPANACIMHTSPHPLSALRLSDRCSNGARFRGAVVYSMPWVCGVTNWKWEFQELDNAMNPIGLPIIAYRNAPSNAINLGTVSALQYGKTYAVRTAPVFAYGEGNFGPAQNMCIIGSSAMPLVNDGAEEISRSVNETSQGSVYPNPNNGQLIYFEDYSIEAGTYLEFELYDVSGKLVERKTLSHSGLTVFELTEKTSNGLYTLIVHDQRLNRQVFRLIVNE